MTLAEMKEILNQKNIDAPLIFSTATEEIGVGYHVTEIKASDISSIDCAGNVSRWTETALQLLDGSHGTHMKVGKFIRILDHSFGAIDALRESPAFVEFAPKNKGLGKYELTPDETGSEIARFTLIAAHDQCKPSLSKSFETLSNSQVTSVQSGCCGGPAPDGVVACCVKDADAKARGESGCGCTDDKSTSEATSAEACCS
jgi:hypothetical protein